jgi:hypothetical protein
MSLCQSTNEVPDAATALGADAHLRRHVEAERGCALSTLTPSAIPSS